MKPGYKQTDVGVIPEDWEIDKIINQASITTGSKNTQDRIEDGTYPFFVRSQTVERINSYSFDGEAVLTAGDGVGTGKIFHYINGKFDYHQRVYKISKFKRTLDGFYFYEIFSNRFYDRIMAMTAKSSVDSVRREMIADMLIPLPSLEEQRLIAEALSDVDKLIQGLEKLIAKKRAIKTGTMQQLLSGKKRLPGFEGEWVTRLLGDLGTFFKGSGVRKDEASSGDLPCIRYGEIYTAHNDYIKEFYSHISREVSEIAALIRFGDILFAGSGETKEDIGKCVSFVDDCEAYAGGDIVIFRPANADPKFLGYYLNIAPINRQKASKGQGDAVVHISATSLAGLSVKIPSSAEQQAIASVLSDMDAEIQALEARLEKTKSIKQGMMSELLTGKTRLI